MFFQEQDLVIIKKRIRSIKIVSNNRFSHAIEAYEHDQIQKTQIKHTHKEHKHARATRADRTIETKIFILI